jgi:methylated-DNA-[protein]-cysteine S-methyltransferase
MDDGDAHADTDTEAGIYTRASAYLDRYVQFGHASGKLLSVSFPTEPDADALDDHPLLDRIDAYLEGATDDFDDVAVALTLPTDRRAVLEALRGVPYGENVSVAALTRMTSGLSADDSEDQTLVREALAANPAPLVVPDHRVRDGPSAAPPGVEQRLRSLEGL